VPEKISVITRKVYDIARFRGLRPPVPLARTPMTTNRSSVAWLLASNVTEIYTVSQKKQATLIFAITSPSVQMAKLWRKLKWLVFSGTRCIVQACSDSLLTLELFFKMDFGVPSALKRAIAILGIATLALTLADSSLPPAGRESDRYRRRPGPRFIPAANENVAESSRDQTPVADPDDVISNDLIINKQTMSHD